MGWEINPVEGGGIADAPTDGKTYGRKDAAWAEVVSAALPLPDVWAPLSDSLRMITGYGREVKVGDDVVSQMVNFSRSTTATYIGKDGLLKTAAANEPRFEKEGLLIEGQSTNLFLYSKSPDSYPWSPNGADTSFIKITDGVRITGIGYYSYRVLPVIAGQAYTFSVTCKVLSGTLNRVGLEGDAALTLGYGLTPENGTVRLSGTVTPNINGYVTCVYYPTQNSVVEFTDIQFEALPFASSYIPTNGAAATRARDVVSLPKSNLPAREHTIAVQLSIRDTRYRFSWVAQGGYICLSIPPDGVVRGWDFSSAVATPSLGSSIPGVVVGCRLRANDRSAFANGVITTESNAGVTEPSPLFPGVDEYLSIGSYQGTHSIGGHIKNIRVWERGLSDEQVKGIC